MLNAARLSSTAQSAAIPDGASRARLIVIAVISFLTLVDLFAAQAILPSLAAKYRVSPAAIGFAVNASTIGLAIAGLAVALLSRHIERRQGIWVSLALLSVPTALLAAAPDLATFAALRIAQGVFMSSAFTLTVAYLAEHLTADDAASALAAYVTGNVASNLFGRLFSAAVADHFGLPANFLLFALLNLAGAALVYVSLERPNAMMPMNGMSGPPMRGSAAWLTHLSEPRLRAAFGIGFLILFAFIGTFTYVNFVLVRAPLSLSTMSLGLVYFVFVPAILTTPLAGRLVSRLGQQRAMLIAFAAAVAGLPLLLSAWLAPVLLGLALVGAGTFGAQAMATSSVSRIASSDRGAASGLYLASYYLGGLTGSSVLGLIFDASGWLATVVTIGISLLAAMALVPGLKRN